MGKESLTSGTTKMGLRLAKERVGGGEITKERARKMEGWGVRGHWAKGTYGGVVNKEEKNEFVIF